MQRHVLLEFILDGSRVSTVIAFLCTFSCMNSNVSPVVIDVYSTVGAVLATMHLFSGMFQQVALIIIHVGRRIGAGWTRINLLPRML